MGCAARGWTHGAILASSEREGLLPTLIDGYDLNVYPLGADRAFDQQSPTHRISWGYRRLAYGSLHPDNSGPGFAAWDRAGIPSCGYGFLRPHTVDDLGRQAQNWIAAAKAVGKTHSIVVDREPDSGIGFNNGMESIPNTQSMINMLDAAGFMVGVYESDSWAFRYYKRIAFTIVANYAHSPATPCSAWQWTGGGQAVPGTPIGDDYDLWLDLPLFRTAFPGTGPIIVPVPPNVTPAPDATEHPMINLVPTTFHRVCAVNLAATFHQYPDANSTIVGIVSHADATPLPGQPAKTMAFGFIGNPVGVAGWTQIANGDFGQWVRKTDIAAVLTGDKNNGV